MKFTPLPKPEPYEPITDKLMNYIVWGDPEGWSPNLIKTNKKYHANIQKTVGISKDEHIA